VLHPGVDHSVFTPRSWEGDDGAPPLALFVGELHPRKGADVFVRALGMVPTDVPARFVFAGPGGSLESVVRAELERSPRRTDVSLLGPISEAALPNLYRSADVLVFPTVWPTEGFGMVAAEAMACAVPVVGSRIAAIPEVVADGRTGLLFDPGDAADLAATLECLLRDRSLRRSLGEAAARRAQAYRWSAIAEALLDDASAEAAVPRR
jgi:glycosyltransferase involved in cell wall biosynthesis